MIRALSGAALAFSLIATPALARSATVAPQVTQVTPQEAQPKIQIAILLDTSSSMDGLINQAREQLWKVVNTFATAKKDGKRPVLELALYEYGNDRLSAEAGYIRQVSPFTTNLDKVSEQLFALRTNGGSEHCGQVISKATEQLEWSKDNKDLKLIYIAGNEAFTQGPVFFESAVKTAIQNGIVVNTIHCGDERSGIAGKWKDAAILADGNFLTIDMNRAVAHVAAPQDAEIARLGAELNKTYVAFGREGGESKERQAKQDENAARGSAGVGTMRAVAKSSAQYDNSEWDLVDARKKGKVRLEEMKPADMPAPMQAMAPAERTAYVEKMGKDRAELQQKIQALNHEREKFVAAEQAKKAKDGTKTLDSAMVESVRAQGAKAAFDFQ
jgi:von Willebrand factor type A domain